MRVTTNSQSLESWKVGEGIIKKSHQPVVTQISGQEWSLLNGYRCTPDTALGLTFPECLVGH